MREITTYYEKNKKKKLNRTKGYYKKNKEILREKARNKCRELSEKGKQYKKRVWKK